MSVRLYLLVLLFLVFKAGYAQVSVISSETPDQISGYTIRSIAGVDSVSLVLEITALQSGNTVRYQTDYRPFKKGTTESPWGHWSSIDSSIQDGDVALYRHGYLEYLYQINVLALKGGKDTVAYTASEWSPQAKWINRSRFGNDSFKLELAKPIEGLEILVSVDSITLTLDPSTPVALVSSKPDSIIVMYNGVDLRKRSSGFSKTKANAEFIEDTLGRSEDDKPESWISKAFAINDGRVMIDAHYANKRPPFTAYQFPYYTASARASLQIATLPIAAEGFLLYNTHQDFDQVLSSPANYFRLDFDKDAYHDQLQERTNPENIKAHLLEEKQQLIDKQKQLLTQRAGLDTVPSLPSDTFALGAQASPSLDTIGRLNQDRFSMGSKKPEAQLDKINARLEMIDKHMTTLDSLKAQQVDVVNPDAYFKSGLSNARLVKVERLQSLSFGMIYPKRYYDDGQVASAELIGVSGEYALGKYVDVYALYGKSRSFPGIYTYPSEVIEGGGKVTYKSFEASTILSNERFSPLLVKSPAFIPDSIWSQFSYEDSLDFSDNLIGVVSLKYRLGQVLEVGTESSFSSLEFVRNTNFNEQRNKAYVSLMIRDFSVRTYGDYVGKDFQSYLDLSQIGNSLLTGIEADYHFFKQRVYLLLGYEYLVSELSQKPRSENRGIKVILNTNFDKTPNLSFQYLPFSGVTQSYNPLYNELQRTSVESSLLNTLVHYTVPFQTGVVNANVHFTRVTNALQFNVATQQQSHVDTMYMTGVTAAYVSAKMTSDLSLQARKNSLDSDVVIGYKLGYNILKATKLSGLTSVRFSDELPDYQFALGVDVNHRKWVLGCQANYVFQQVNHGVVLIKTNLGYIF